MIPLCSHQSLDPGPEEQTLSSYCIRAESLAGLYESADRSQMQQVMSSIFRPGDKVLELGCGSGADAAMLLKAGIDMVASDGCSGMILEATRRHPELAEHLTPIQLPGVLPFDDGTFNGILATAFLMHFSEEHLPGVCAEMARVLEPGGVMFIAVFSGRDDLDADGFDRQGRFFNRLPLSRIAEMFLAAGVDCRRHYPAPDALGRGGIVLEQGIFEKGK